MRGIFCLAGETRRYRALDGQTDKSKGTEFVCPSSTRPMSAG